MLKSPPEIDNIKLLDKINESPSFKEKAADNVAKFGGSWIFIILFSVFFIGWIVLNVFIIHADTYPFILLNLILSCLAVFQAPFILMSQNRKSDIDRKRAENDYKVDLINQIKINELHAKMDIIIEKITT